MISHLLTLTAWSMTPPAVWSPFHLVFMLIGIPLAAFAAWKLRTRSEAFRLHLLFACGVFLAFSEVYKQLFLYYIENNRHYDWCCHPDDTYYLIGSTVGPHPYPDKIYPS